MERVLYGELDIVGLGVREFQRPLRQRQFITRFRTLEPKENLVTGDWLGFAAGQNPQRVIWYDKLQEQAGSADALYLEALTARRYGGTLPSCAARLEVQLSRPWLIRQGITSPADLRRLGSLTVQKVLSKSLRLTADRVDAKHKNHQRAHLHPLWAALQTAAINVFGQPEGTLAPLDRSRIAPDRLSKQGRGCLENSLHQRAIDCPTYGDFTAAVVEELLRLAPTIEAQELFMEEFQRRQSEFGS